MIIDLADRMMGLTASIGLMKKDIAVLGSRFIRALKPSPPRYLSRLKLFLGYLDRKIDDATNRASYNTPNGYGSRLLVDIIKLADLDTLLASDISLQTGPYLLSITKDLEKPIDVRNGKTTTKNLFIHSKRPCFELMTASRRKSPLIEIPWDKEYKDPAWASIQPLRICDMGTTDLRFQIFQDTLSYMHHGPTHAIYSLDCFALVAKFVAYYKAQGNVPNRDQCLLDFVHNEIIVPSILQDSMAIWLRNVYKQQLMTASRLESHTSTIWDIVNIDTIGSDFTGAMIDVMHLRNDLRNESISNQTVMSSLLLTSSKSFTEYYTQLYDTTRVPDQQQFLWVDILKNLSWWNFILLVNSFSSDLPDSISFEKDVIRDIRIAVMLKPWQNINGSIAYKTLVRVKLEGMLQYLKEQI